MKEFFTLSFTLVACSALSTSENQASRSILKSEASRLASENIKHLIIFMQENRPFDHYFGTLKGVRGFNDRTPIMLRSGRDAFHQPIDQSNLEDYMLPFHTIANETNAMCMPAPEMYYPTDLKILNYGRMDSWNTARNPGYGMAYFTREDLPYYYNLYDNFLVGDHYFQSTFTCTNPNRMMLFTGSNGLSVDQGCILENNEPRPGFNWTTVAETLTNKDISWKVYQQLDNFDDNAFAWFNSFQQSRPGDILFEQGMRRMDSIFNEIENDMASGSLPTVSWIIAPTRKSEHATNHPCAGEDFTASLLKILESHPEIYKSTAFILNYDEGGQFYDHVVPPTPPITTNEGFSSVTVQGEVNSITLTDVPAPIGLGFRVPLLVVSPWTRGNLVLSEVLDHTSVLQFMESWLDIEVSVISPWRRLVTGNLLAAFDFENPDFSWPSNLPDTSKYVESGDVECFTLPDPIIPAEQSMPRQEPGTRISRALPYEVRVSDKVSPSSVDVYIVNSGDITKSEGIPLILFDLLHLDTVIPKKYSLRADPSFTFKDSVEVAESDSGVYAFVLMGPNGFLRELRGNSAVCNGISVELDYSIDTEEVVLRVSGYSDNYQRIVITDPVYELIGAKESNFSTIIDIKSEPTEIRVPTASSGHWYDLILSIQTTSENSAVDTNCLYRRFMGRMETGVDSISDPAMGAAKDSWLQLLSPFTRSDNSRPLPPAFLSRNVVQHKPTERSVVDKDARFYSKDFSKTEL